MSVTREVTLTIPAGETRRVPAVGTLFFVKEANGRLDYKFFAMAGFGNDGAYSQFSMARNEKVRFPHPFDEIEAKNNNAGSVTFIAIVGDGDFDNLTTGGSTTNRLPITTVAMTGAHVNLIAPTVADGLISVLLRARIGNTTPIYVGFNEAGLDTAPPTNCLELQPADAVVLDISSLAALGSDQDGTGLWSKGATAGDLLELGLSFSE